MRNGLLLKILILGFFISSCGPSIEPTETPTVDPTETPTVSPTENPTEAPTDEPTEEPTEASTEEPTEAPTEQPTETPTVEPTETPTEEKIIEETYFRVKETLIETDYTSYEDPYINIDEDEFYENYKISDSYIDSYYRSLHGLLCGELIEDDGSPKQYESAPMKSNDIYYKNAYIRFGVNADGDRVSYTINTLDDSDYTIYKDGIYTSMNDVAAYLFAFNDLPKNYLSGTSLKNEAYNLYGEFGRVNFNKYSGPSATKYQYEPYLKGQEDKTLYYRETDFGATYGPNYYYTYNDRHNGSNGREIFRFLVANSYDSSYTYAKKSTDYSTPNPTSIDDRYVYYTFNHYNDFVEYLNYYNGFTAPFGNMTAGNNMNEYNASNPPTERFETQLALF